MTRVFTAVEIEDEELLDELEYIRNTLDMNFRTVPREKMHITLEFFKDLKEDEIEHLVKYLQEADLESFKARIEGVGAFPSKNYMRVVWAGAEAEEFEKLHEKSSRHEQESDNSHDFHPHITLFRVENASQERKKKLRKGLQEYREYFFGEIAVNSIKLYESRLSEEGSTYRLLEEIKF